MISIEINLEYNNKLTTNEIINILNVLILAKKREKALSFIEEIFSDEENSLEKLKCIAIRIYTLIDETYKDFYISIDNNLNFNVLASCLCENNKQLLTFISKNIEQLFLHLHTTYTLYSPITLEALKYINSFYYEDISIRNFSLKHNINSSYFGRKFNNEVGLSFSDCLNKKRSHEAKNLILMSSFSIKEISFKVGYLDISHFYKNFKKNFGISPAKYRDLKIQKKKNF
ncbi:MAG: helix-turn-helix transcriptional regulator [Sarcina sp.]